MLSLLCATVLGLSANFEDTPKLTVVISIDQFRRDYIGRWSDLYLPPTSRDGVGGFRWLSERGANFANSAYTHIPTETGPGHAIIGTGSDPSQTGIVGNEWFDRSQNKVIYCVADPDAKDIFTGTASYSPKNLAVGTFCDELETSTGGLARTASVSFKDRAAIGMGGRMPDDIVWYDTTNGRWTTSDFYEKTQRLPEWATKMNTEKWPDHHMAWYGMAGAYNKKSDYKNAADTAGKAVKIAPDQAMYHQFYGLMLYEKAVYEAKDELAKKEDKKIEDVKPDLGNINFETALKHLQEAVKLNPDLWKAHYGIGRIHRDKGNAKEAAEALTKALQAGPTESAPWVLTAPSEARAASSRAAVDFGMRDATATSLTPSGPPPSERSTAKARRMLWTPPAVPLAGPLLAPYAPPFVGLMKTGPWS